MRHKANIGLIDPHTKGDCRHHNHPLLRQETVLVMLSQLCVQTGVIRERIKALFSQPSRRIFDSFAGHTIDHTGILSMLSANEIE